MPWNGRSARAAVAVATLVVAARPGAAVESFLAPNPQAPDAVPYRSAPGDRTPHRLNSEVEQPDAGGAAEQRTPTPTASEDADRGIEAQD